MPTEHLSSRCMSLPVSEMACLRAIQHHIFENLFLIALIPIRAMLGISEVIATTNEQVW